MFYLNKWGHIVSSLSCADIISVLFFGGFLYDNEVQNGRIVLSKGHAAAALYAALSISGALEYRDLSSFSQNGSSLFALSSNSIPEIEIPTGSLGHGLPYATGRAYIDKLENKSKKTYVILGDGESQEGSIWEAAMFSGNHELDNIIAILDNNRIQGSNWVAKEAGIEPIKDKWQSFGWEVYVCDGHNLFDLQQNLQMAQSSNGKPKMIIANTIKGRGIKIAENRPELHSWKPSDEEWMLICKEYGITKDDLRL
jgi:transketolase